MSDQFKVTVTVEEHAKYGAFKGSDHKFYKAPKEMALEDFVVGKAYLLEGFKSESGKTNYITDSTLADGEPAKPKAGRRLPAPKAEVASTGRDFVKEAKGKTFSLIVAGLSHTDLKAEDILTKADVLLKGIEDRKYF